jgi:serine/threonine-protein kinase
MAARITLRVTRGKLNGREFVFQERMTCLVGRGPDCLVQLPNDDDHRLVSRHHCLLDVNPPDVRIRDLGSRNGTYVNGVKIGQRPADAGAEQKLAAPFPEQDLQDGDEIELGGTVLRVEVFCPPTCAVCGAEVPEAAAAAAAGAHVCCRACQPTPSPRQGPAPRGGPVAVCAQCGRDVSEEISAGRQGSYVCLACREQPRQLVEGFLAGSAPEPPLVSIRGLRVLRELGRGGMGVVYLARRERTGEQVAIKVMLPRVVADDRATQMFLREVKCSRLLRHPNIVQVLGSGSSEGAFFCVLEYCEGGSVYDLVERQGPLGPDEALPLALQALAGLEYGHSIELSDARRTDGQGPARGVIHRDLKPSNILLAGSGAGRVAKVADFGLAKAFDQAGLSGLTCTGAVGGSPAFMPRQQLINYKYAKPEVDVWGLAATLYFLLTSLPPRDFPPGADQLSVVLETPAVPIRSRNPALPARLAEVIDAALVDHPAIGFRSAAEFRQALEAAS